MGPPFFRSFALSPLDGASVRDFIDIGKFEVGPIVSRLPCLLLSWWRQTFRDMTTSVHVGSSHGKSVQAPIRL